MGRPPRPAGGVPGSGRPPGRPRRPAAARPVRARGALGGAREAARAGAARPVQPRPGDDVARRRPGDPPLGVLRRRLGPVRGPGVGAVGAPVRRRPRRQRCRGAAVHARGRPARPHPVPAAGQPRLHPARDGRVGTHGPADRRGTARRARARPGHDRSGDGVRRPAAGARDRRPAGGPDRAPRGLPALGRGSSRDPGPRPAAAPLPRSRARAAGHACLPARPLRAAAPGARGRPGEPAGRRCPRRRRSPNANCTRP